MTHSNEESRSGDTSHEKLQEESILLALGHTPDIPLVDITLHLMQCVECRRVVAEINEVAGYLPESLGQVSPPSHVRENIIDRATKEDGPSGDETKSLSMPKRRQRWTFVAWVALVGMLIAGNGAWWQYAHSRQNTFTALENQYKSDLQWLRSAEQLLVSGEPPAYSGNLQSVSEPVTGHEQTEPLDIQTHGRAVVYITSYDRVYLIVQVDGLRATTPYSVWIHEGEDMVHIGDFTSTPTGSGNYVYASDASDWWSNDFIAIRVKEEPIQRAILHGIVNSSTRLSEEIM